VGYVTGGAVFFTDAVDKSTATEDIYEDVDITGDLQGSEDANGAIVMFNQTNNRRAGALRENGASYDYYEDVSHQFAMVSIDSDDIFEQKIDYGDMDLHLIGYTLAEVTAGLIAHWKFDEGTGQTAADSSGNGNDGMLGTTTGVDDQDPTWTCVSGPNSLTFDGDDDEVALPGPVIGDRTAWTVTAWIKVGADTADKRTIYSEGDTSADEYWTLYVGESENYVKFWSPNGSAYLSGTTNVEDDTWHLVTLVQRSKTDRELYVGTESQDTDDADMGTLNYDVAAIGTLDYVYGPCDWFKGTIDDVRIYDRALSVAEITALVASYL